MANKFLHEIKNSTSKDFAQTEFAKTFVQLSDRAYANAIQNIIIEHQNCNSDEEKKKS